MHAIDAPVNLDLVENHNHLPSKGSPKKLILKLNRRKDARRILLNKKTLRELKSEFFNLPAGVKIYVTENLSLLQKSMDKLQEIMECQANFVLLGE